MFNSACFKYRQKIEQQATDKLRPLSRTEFNINNKNKNNNISL